MNTALQPEQTERAERESTPPSVPSVSSGSIFRPSDDRNAGVELGTASLARSMQRFFAGHVSRTVLLTRFLPLSFASLFGGLIVAAFFFPTSFDWRVQVISVLTSPYSNPRGCWLAAFGTMAAMLLILPFAGYAAARLHAIAPQPARPAGAGFALSFTLTFLAVALQLLQPLIGLRWLHGFLAVLAAGCFIAGMLCGCACAIQERRRGSSQPKCLSATLVWSWLLFILVPTGCLTGLGVILLLGQHAGVTWAEDFRQSFRHTVLWHLAFWEWIGVGLGYVFMALSVLLLPTPCEERRTRSGCPSIPTEVSALSLSREQWRP